MNILTLFLIFGLAVAKDASQKVFSPNFGPQKQVLKVLTHNQGLSVKHLLKTQGFLSFSMIANETPISKIKPKENSNNNTVVKDKVIIDEQPKEYVDENLGDFSNESIDDSTSSIPSFEYSDFEEWFKKDLESSDIFFANSSYLADNEDDTVGEESGCGELCE